MGIQTIPPAELPSLFGKTRQALLSLLYGHADEAHLQEDLIRIAALGRGSVQRELEFLTRAGIVQRIVRGRQVYFQANSESPVFAELRGLVVKTGGVAGILRAALEPLAGRIAVAFVFGSVAKGQERRASDVDVMVIGDLSFEEAVAALARSQAVIGREVNPSVYGAADFRAKLASSNHFLKNVMKAEKIYLIGDAHELARLAKK